MDIILKTGKATEEARRICLQYMNTVKGHGIDQTRKDYIKLLERFKFYCASKSFTTNSYLKSENILSISLIKQ